MVKLVWLIATIAADGPVTGKIQELVKFETVAACEAFVKEMTPRVEDYVRGVVRGDWNHHVEVRYHCDDGTPV